MITPVPSGAAIRTAFTLIERPKALRRSLMFHPRSDGCDGSIRMCCPRAELGIGAADALPGTIGDRPSRQSAAPFAWAHAPRVIDALPVHRLPRGAGRLRPSTRWHLPSDAESVVPAPPAGTVYVHSITEDLHP